MTAAQAGQPEFGSLEPVEGGESQDAAPDISVPPHGKVNTFFFFKKKK